MGMRTDAAEVTILTVCIEKHFDYIRRQTQLIDALNPGVDWKMLVVDNSRTDVSAFSIDDPRVEVIPGVSRPTGLPDNFAGSYHHAAALNAGARRISTRYALVLDPDLFVVYRNWIRETVALMTERRLSFFGVPWHARWYTKYRDYPCVHFLLIDQDKVKAADIDFSPSIETARPRLPWRLFKKTSWFSTRGRINVSRDTGWRLGHVLRRRHAAEITPPVLDLDAHLTKPAFLTTAWGRWGERRLPSSLSLLPRPGSYVEPRQAPGFASEVMQDLEAEMFVWRGAPFAFHLRRHVRDTVRGGTDRAAEDRRLSEALDGAARHRLWSDWVDPGRRPEPSAA